MNNAIIIYSRMGSSRLPGKATKFISEYPLLEHIVLRIKKIENKIENLSIIIATTVNREDDIISEIAEKLNVECFRGHPTDLIDRTSKIINKHKLDTFCRVNGDCPFVDANLILKGYDILKNSNYLLVTNILKRTFPYGVAVEWVDCKKYLELNNNVKDVELEHVTMHLYKDLSKNEIYNIENDLDYSHLELAVDLPADLTRIKSYFDNNKNISCQELNFKQLNN
ncbi:hypothetical protein LDL76_16100 [Salegentibacter mishustinae]|uniref:cytidylyltransferase domain-containing protein n=1 Tax=Salegentibacter mishustinae TaxID=270918 RepID=UPI001CE0AC1F|nr:hypothetical protein [Salegentibacter mishustinae]UBZ06865.1 hypothetical protein LDL76_16100 [Salegentibacter mishustinae]